MAAEQVRDHVNVLVAHFRDKAGSSKNAAKALAFFSVAGGAVVPVLLLTSVPSWVVAGISALAAVSAAWLQIRKHAERWTIYRTAQRDLEKELNDHQFLVGPYQGQADPDALLAARANELTHHAHYEWMPTTQALQNIGKDAKR